MYRILISAVVLMFTLSFASANDIANFKSAVVAIGGEKLDNSNPSKPDKKFFIGTGFFIGENLIITNDHVVKDSTTLSAMVEESGNKYELNILFEDPRADIALVQLKDWAGFKEHNDPIYLKFANKDNISDAEDVYAIGMPWGLGWSISKGIISYNYRLISGLMFPSIQTDAHVFEGNSGGPLLNEHGEVVGMNSEMLADVSGSYGFAIPSAIIEKVLRDFNAYKEVRWTWTGIQVDPSGKITDIVKGSPADKSGMLVGDVLKTVKTEFGTMPVDRLDRFIFEIMITDYTDDITLTINRNDQQKEFNIIPEFKLSKDIS